MTATLIRPGTGRVDTPGEPFYAAADLEMLFATAVLVAADRRGDMARIGGGPRLAVAVPPVANGSGWVATAAVDRGVVSILAEHRGTQRVRVIELPLLSGSELAAMDPRYWDEIVTETVAAIPEVAAALIEEVSL